MLKRRASPDLQQARPQKASKSRQDNLDRLSLLTDELLLRVLSHLSVHGLTICQRISKRLANIAGDSHLWQSAYYDRFVRPRADRIPGIRSLPHTPHRLTSSRLSKWLDERHLLQTDPKTDWKKQYRLRHNWTRGQCGITEIPVGRETSSTPSVLAKLQGGIVYTVDRINGLRSFSYKDDQKLLAAHEITGQSAQPTAIALRAPGSSTEAQVIAIGFEDGSFTIHTYDSSEHIFRNVYRHNPSSNGAITAIDCAGPYLCCMSKLRLFSLYRFDAMSYAEITSKIPDPTLIASLSSHTIWPPVAVSLRLSGDTIVASIAYAFPTYSAGWSAGIQELHIRQDGVVDESRLATAHAQTFSPLSDHNALATSFPDYEGSRSKPTSLSYSHPYLLFCHSDNTLTLYLVKSSRESLSIGKGKRLWGHTSSVFGAHVGGRGRAVSVTTRGEEVRVWELEGSTLISTSQARERRDPDTSVKVDSERRRSSSQPTQSLNPTWGLQSMSIPFESSITKGWVGFDEDSVVVLRERQCGSHAAQALAVYDFT